MNIQAPPNLNPGGKQTYLSAGMNDWGGVSPLTADFINPEAPWPQLAHLRKITAASGFELRERLALYPEYVTSNEWLLPEQLTVRIQELSGPDGLVKRELEI